MHQNLMPSPRLRRTLRQNGFSHPLQHLGPRQATSLLGADSAFGLLIKCVLIGSQLENEADGLGRRGRGGAILDETRYRRYNFRVSSGLKATFRSTSTEVCTLANSNHAPSVSGVANPCITRTLDQQTLPARKASDINGKCSNESLV